MHSLVATLSNVSTLASLDSALILYPSWIYLRRGRRKRYPNLLLSSKHHADLVVRPAAFVSSLLWGDSEIAEGCFLQYVSRKRSRCAECPCGVYSVIFEEWCPRGVLVPALSLTLRHCQDMSAQINCFSFPNHASLTRLPLNDDHNGVLRRLTTSGKTTRRLTHWQQ